MLWANLDASSLEAAMHLENRSQILASTSGEMREAASKVLRKTYCRNGIPAGKVRVRTCWNAVSAES